ncbi:7dab5a10-4ed7-4200-a87e-662dec82b238 [Thermothielavioides terrestris]|uniref:PEBP-like protein n=2 Tax=Thermothielavioides terrestris TaxID=2587410 RepID=G2QYR5_THETT|nr:uncharacterized protein THITE_2114226 [Thermothielavioides terrestris NRRL 8126]AEO66257.1 hypothetical protein THITE_2114226 [Thermothielavioides terrestris NRRL 8126]SPQ25367.1 7dab5a10-4ed7-4200-a87e-662dec82b238 [Thermothielavioides terrestris]
MAATLLNSLKQANLLPSKVIPADFVPAVALDVRYPTKHISNGTLVRVSEVGDVPSISVSPIPTADAAATAPPSPASPKSKFTFMLIDPDAPTPDDPKFGYWRHWVVTNIDIDLDAAGEGTSVLDRGRTLTRYLAPGPRDESGPHRYLFLLFREPEAGLRLEQSDVGGEAFVERRSFRAEEFVERHGLRLVGVQWMRGVGDGWKGEE